MANKEHLKILMQGVEAWNQWRKQNPDFQPDLSTATLRGMNLTDADLRKANLRYVDMSRVCLDVANLNSADLEGANLSGSSAWFADLSDANLRKTSLAYAVLHECDLDGADLNNSIVHGTHFNGLNLSTVIGLETVHHDGPSSLGVDTLHYSNGEIPVNFLRGCGVPDDLIDFVQSWALNPIEFNSCFISYSTKDEQFAQRLYKDLQANGVRCWFAPHDVKGGRKLHEQIDLAIRLHDRLLLILSQDSINSEWVKREIDKARKREAREKRDVLFPISLVNYKTLCSWEYLDPDTGKDVAQEIRSFFIPDFSNWKNHDSYQKAFKDLLRDLQGEKIKAAPATK